MFDASHAYSADLDCLDCAGAWPCAGYQDLVCALFKDDMDAVAAFMRFFVPEAALALGGLSRRTVEQRVVGWCEQRRRSRPAAIGAPLSPVSSCLTAGLPLHSAMDLVGVKGAA